MKRTARWLFLILAFALVAAACGDDDEPATTTAAPPATTEAPPATTEAPPPTAAPTTTEAPPPTTEAPPAEQTLIVGTTDSIASLDPADAYAVHDWELLKNIGEPLLRWEPGSGDVLVPAAAQDFGEFSDDGLSYTIRLREGQVFGDGTPLTAQTYADQINNRLLVLEGPNGVGPALGQPYVTSAEALDDVTVKFNLSDTWGFFEQLLAGAPYIPSNPTQFGAELNLFPDAPIYGNGPWFIESYTPDEQTVLRPNPLYDGPFPAELDRVIIRYFSTPQAMKDAVAAREIDVAWRILGPDLLAELEGTEGLNVERINAGPIRYFIVNHTLAPMDDPNVRAAVAYAIDRDEISDRVFAGAVDPLFSQVPPGFLGATEAFDIEYAAPDVAAAQAALAASGYTADNPLELDLWYPPEHYGGVVAPAMEVVKEQLEATGAINVTLQAQEWSTYVGAVVGGQDYALSFLGWFYDYPDPDNYLGPFILNGGLGTNVTDPDTGEGIDAQAQQLVDLVTEAAAESDPAVRADLYEQAQDIYAELVTTLPLWIEAEHVVYWDDVTPDDAFGSVDTLNIGATIEFNYSTLSLG